MALWVLHVDLDQFIAAVEVLRHPELRGRPVVVGGDGDPAKRGVVSTASYEARAHGVHSGLALRTAQRRCPDAVFLPVDRAAYEAVSATVMATLREFDAVVEVMGWDDLNWLEDVHLGYEEGRAAIFDRNVNGWVTVPKDVKLPDNQQDRDMLARELLIKFQLSPRHPLVDLNKAYRKF